MSTWLLGLGLLCLWLQTLCFGVYFMYPTTIDAAIYFGRRRLAYLLIAILAVALGGSIWMLLILSESFARMFL